MTVRAMTLDELQTVLGWAADEGWNPGLDDANAFHAADPAGFLIKELHGKPIAAISVVNHDPDFAFLGLYLCKPEHRGQGHGMDIWRAGIAHAGGRSIGLDGVPDQQANYARSGFAKFGSTVRFEGQIDASSGQTTRLALPSDLPHLIRCDTKATGIKRTAFASTWFGQSPTRQTLVLADGKNIKGFATFRRCNTGTKAGPLQAGTETDARALLTANPFAASGEPMFVDVQEGTCALAMLLNELGFAPVYETARMFRGTPPETEQAPFQAIATMELG